MQSWKDQPPCPSLHHPENIQHRTSNGSANPRSLRRSKFDVGRSMFSLGHGASPFAFARALGDRKSTRLNSSHLVISYAVFCLKKKKDKKIQLCSTSRLY